MDKTIPSSKAASLPALNSPKEKGWLCKKIELLGFKLVVIGKNPYLARQISITIPGGLTLLGLHSKRYGYTLNLQSDSKICPKWSKKLVEFH